MKKIYFTVTNDLSYDQRMDRICTSLAENGYVVTLVGRKRKKSPPLLSKKFGQKRIRCCFNKGKLFYFEYNVRLFFYLLFCKMDAICAIDLDTILPCYYISRLKRIPRIYDAHELFTEMKEVITRPRIHKFWKRIEKNMVPKFQNGYTVSDSIAAEFNKRYSVKYSTIRNVPVSDSVQRIEPAEKFILYQGAVNEGRGLEWLVPAMQWVNAKLVICGDGNFMWKLRQLTQEYDTKKEIELTGMLSPAELRKFTSQATLGISLAEKQGLNQWLALPNKFFDYIHAGLPQVTMNFPEYKKINDEYEVAVLIDDLEPIKIAEAINNLLGNTVLLMNMRENCRKAKMVFNWENEEKKLLEFYQSIFK